MKANSENPFLQAALSLAKKGFEVFPIKPGSKFPPLVAFTTEATTLEPKIKQWWTKYPEANIGIHCKGLLVADIDTKKSGADSLMELEMQGQEFPETLEQITPTGGSHFIYRSDSEIQNTISKLGPGIDTRGLHGYIVGAGSVTEKGIYRFKDPEKPIAKAPKWIASRLIFEPKIPTPTKVFETPDPQTVELAAHYLKHTALPACEGDGGRTRLFQVAATATERFRLPLPILERLMTEHYNPRCEPPWQPEQSNDFSNIIRDGHSKSTDVRPSFAEAFGIADSHNTSTPHEKPALFMVQDQRSPDLMEIDLVEGLLAQNSLATLVGPSNVGKTFVALDLAFSVARGTPWLGRHESLPGTALYIGLESSSEEINRRVAAYRQYYPATGNAPLYLATKSLDLSSPKSPGWQQVIPEVNALKSPEMPIRLIIIDTLARALSGADENSAKDMGSFIKGCDKLRELTGACVLIIHHLGKDTSRGGRGSSSLFAGIDTELRVSDNKCITAAKQRAMAKAGVAIYYDLVPVEIGLNPKGKPVTACVVVERKPGAAESFNPATDEAASAEEAAGLVGRGIWGIQKAFADALDPDDPMAEVKSVDEDRVWDAIHVQWYSDKPDNVWRSAKSKMRIKLKDAGIKFNKGRVFR